MLKGPLLIFVQSTRLNLQKQSFSRDSVKILNSVPCEVQLLPERKFSNSHVRFSTPETFKI